jgi:2-keto-4-pentenoate hydratase/2-oxohepta-3-ene-1,7-dioic acid hydratase in catechol pathway
VRLVSYRAEPGRPGWRSGIEVDGLVVDTRTLASRLGWSPDAVAAVGGNRGVVALAPEDLKALEKAAADVVHALGTGEGVHDRGAVRLGPPVPDPQKIVCLGLNYRDHAEETGLEPPPVPLFFAKFANSLAGPDDDIVPPALTRKVDYEAELAVVIGRRARYVPEDRALDHVAGAMALNDVSARDLQNATSQWTAGKAIDTFAPCGPALVTRESLGDLHALGVRARVNGRTVQDGTTASMIFPIPRVVAYLSELMTLEPGDVIATGTPAGVGQSRTPPLFLGPGDVVEVEIDGIGRLRNTVREGARP